VNIYQARQEIMKGKRLLFDIERIRKPKLFRA
jgi:hypothetical protein